MVVYGHKTPYGNSRSSARTSNPKFGVRSTSNEVFGVQIVVVWNSPSKKSRKSLNKSKIESRKGGAKRIIKKKITPG